HKRTQELATKARDGKLKPEEFIGGTFSISNLGMFGIREFAAVINPPQAAILAVSGARQGRRCIIILGNQYLMISVVVVFDEKSQKPKAVNLMNTTLSVDGRAVTEEAAAQFLEQFGKYVSNPTAMIV